MWQPTIYILGNPGVFQSALEGLQAIFSPPSRDPNAWAGGSGSGFAIGTIIKIGFMVGLLALAGRGLINQRYEWHNLAIGLLVYVALFIPTTDVIVYDLYSGTSFEVSHIPIGVAYPAGFASEASYYLMNVMDTVNQDPQNSAPPIDMSTGGFEAPLMTVMALRGLPAEFQHYNPGFFHNIVNFTKNCDASGTTFNLSNDIEHQPQIMTTLLSSSTYNANARTAIYDDSFPFGANNIGTMSCANAATFLSSEWTTFATNTTNGAVTEEPVINYTSATSGQEYTIYPLSFILGTQIPQAGMASLTGSTAGGPGTAIPLDTVKSEINALIPNCSGAGDGETCADGSLAINFMKNQISGCLATAGSQLYRQSGVPSPTVALPGFCLDMSNALAVQQEKNAGMASVFEANVVPLMTILQFLFFALAPLVALMVAFMGSSGNHGVYSKYMLFGIWTESFLPVAALINDYSQFQVQNVLNQQMTAGTGTAISNMSDFINIGSVFSHVQLALSSANMMIVAVPVLTFSILTGSYYAMTKLGGMISAESSMTPEATAQVQPPKFNQSANGYDVNSTGRGQVFAGSAYLNSSPALNVAGALSSASSAMSAATANESRALSDSFQTSQLALSNLLQSYTSSQGFDQKTASSLQNNLNTMKQTQNKLGLLDAQTNGQAQTWANEAAAGVGLDAILASVSDSYKKSHASEYRSQVQQAMDYGQTLSTQNAEAYSTVQRVEGSNKELSAAKSDFTKAVSAQRQQAAQVAESFATSQQLQNQVSQADNSGMSQNITATQAVARVLSANKKTGDGWVKMQSALNHLQRIDPKAYNAGIHAQQISGIKGPQGTMIALSAGTQAAVQSGTPQQAAAAALNYANLLGVPDNASAAAAQFSSTDTAVRGVAGQVAAGTESVPSSPSAPGGSLASAVPTQGSGSGAQMRSNAEQGVAWRQDVQNASQGLKAQYEQFHQLAESQQGAFIMNVGGGSAAFKTKAAQQQYVSNMKKIAAMPTATNQERDQRVAAMQALAASADVPANFSSQVAAFAGDSQSQIDSIADAAGKHTLHNDHSQNSNPITQSIFSLLSTNNFTPTAAVAAIIGGSIAARKITQSLSKTVTPKGDPMDTHGSGIRYNAKSTGTTTADSSASEAPAVEDAVIDDAKTFASGANQVGQEIENAMATATAPLEDANNAIASTVNPLVAEGAPVAESDATSVADNFVGPLMGGG